MTEERPSVQWTLDGFGSKPVKLLKYRSGLLIQAFRDFVRLGGIIEPFELGAKLLSVGLRERIDQKADNPVFPDIVLGPQDAPYVRFQWCPHRSQERSEDARDRPIVVAKPANEFAKDGGHLRIAGINCGACALQIGFCDWDEMPKVVFQDSCYPLATPCVFTYSA